MCFGQPSVQGIRFLLAKIFWTFLTAAISVSFRELKSDMKERLSSICSKWLMSESTIIMPGKPAVKRRAAMMNLGHRKLAAWGLEGFPIPGMGRFLIAAAAAEPMCRHF